MKNLNAVWRALEMALINCEIYVIQNWSANSVISDTAANQDTTSAITDTKLYVPVVTLSTQGNTKLLRQLKSGFKRTINWNKYQSDPKTYAQNQYLNHLDDPSFQGTNRLLYYLSKMKMIENQIQDIIFQK